MRARLEAVGVRDDGLVQVVLRVDGKTKVLTGLFTTVDGALEQQALPGMDRWKHAVIDR